MGESMEHYIRLKDVSIEIPVFTSASRSLRHRFGLARLNETLNKTITSAPVGGKLETSTRGYIVKALEDVNLELNHGDRLGLVGHNGAGKTTLLRTLAGIYEPTSGTAEIAGDVLPLFALETGMDPDSTGYENIRLRGRILGLSRRDLEEVERDIAEFSELGDYLEMPIRTYSSGMMVRLSFGIATAVHSDILLLDEMIGAGDASFVTKAQERLASFVERSGIMVVASHNPGILQQWCNRAALMNAGRITKIGEVQEVLDAYAAETQAS